MSIVLLNNNTPRSVLYGTQQDVVLQPLGGYLPQYFVGDSEVTGAWEQDGAEWYAEMPTPWDDILSDRYTPGKPSIVPVKLHVTTEISFKFKTTFGPQHQDTYLSNPGAVAGGVFLFFVSSANAGAFLGDEDAATNVKYYGGWHDWTEISFSLAAGEHFFYFDCAHVFIQDTPRWTARLSTYPDLIWGEVPGGETPTYQARVKDFVFSPANIPYGPVCSTHGIGGTGNNPIEFDTWASTIAVVQPLVGSGDHELINSEAATLAAPQPGIAGAMQIPTAQATVSSKNIAYKWSMLPTRASQAKMIYICTVGDLEIPISSFTAVMRNGTQSYLNVVVPNITAYESDINARSDEEIVIYKGYEYADGTRNLEAVVKSNFESLRVDQGGVKASGTIIGYRQKTYTTGVEREIQNVQYRQIGANGNLRLRGEIDLFLKPGDICMYGENSFIVDYVTYYVSPSLAYMEVSE